MPLSTFTRRVCALLATERAVQDELRRLQDKEQALQSGCLSDARLAADAARRQANENVIDASMRLYRELRDAEVAD